MQIDPGCDPESCRLLTVSYARFPKKMMPATLIQLKAILIGENLPQWLYQRDY
jgi:hypothetical protein